ncbi:hypothetical protein DFJ73DRAFT_930006 [Zopfochytrium polystomum]|nr:hypothetical protein DFJ73DRAFT_930006 [Zopfochytrium polystomum]
MPSSTNGSDPSRLFLGLLRSDARSLYGCVDRRMGVAWVPFVMVLSAATLYLFDMSDPLRANFGNIVDTLSLTEVSLFRIGVDTSLPSENNNTNKGGGGNAAAAGADGGKDASILIVDSNGPRAVRWILRCRQPTEVALRDETVRQRTAVKSLEEWLQVMVASRSEEDRAAAATVTGSASGAGASDRTGRTAGPAVRTRSTSYDSGSRPVPAATTVQQPRKSPSTLFGSLKQRTSGSFRNSNKSPSLGSASMKSPALTTASSPAMSLASSSSSAYMSMSSTVSSSPGPAGYSMMMSKSPSVPGPRPRPTGSPCHRPPQQQYQQQRTTPPPPTSLALSLSTSSQAQLAASRVQSAPTGGGGALSLVIPSETQSVPPSQQQQRHPPRTTSSNRQNSSGGTPINPAVVTAATAVSLSHIPSAASSRSPSPPPSAAPPPPSGLARGRSGGGRMMRRSASSEDHSSRTTYSIADPFPGRGSNAKHTAPFRTPPARFAPLPFVGPPSVPVQQPDGNSLVAPPRKDSAGTTSPMASAVAAMEANPLARTRLQEFLYNQQASRTVAEVTNGEESPLTPRTRSALAALIASSSVEPTKPPPAPSAPTMTLPVGPLPSTGVLSSSAPARFVANPVVSPPPFPPPTKELPPTPNSPMWSPPTAMSLGRSHPNGFLRSSSPAKPMSKTPSPPLSNYSNTSFGPSTTPNSVRTPTPSQDRNGNKLLSSVVAIAADYAASVVLAKKAAASAATADGDSSVAGPTPSLSSGPAKKPLLVVPGIHGKPVTGHLTSVVSVASSAIATAGSPGGYRDLDADDHDAVGGGPVHAPASSASTPAVGAALNRKATNRNVQEQVGRLRLRRLETVEHSEQSTNQPPRSAAAAASAAANGWSVPAPGGLGGGTLAALPIIEEDSEPASSFYAITPLPWMSGSLPLAPRGNQQQPPLPTSSGRKPSIPNRMSSLFKPA